MAERFLLPLEPTPEGPPPAAVEYLPLAPRILAEVVLAILTALFGVLWATAVRRRQRPYAGYAWSTGIMALATVFVGILAFWKPRG